MVQNFFRIAIRNILRHKVFTIINVTGLAIGLASALLIITTISKILNYYLPIFLIPPISPLWYPPLPPLPPRPPLL